jgi:hypothetical protein
MDMISDSIPTFWDCQTRLTYRLLVWSALSVAFSALTVVSANLFLRGLAIQFFAWGAIDAGSPFLAQAPLRKNTRVRS